MTVCHSVTTLACVFPSAIQSATCGLCEDLSGFRELMHALHGFLLFICNCKRFFERDGGERNHSECTVVSCATLLTILSALPKGVRTQTKYQPVINTCLAAVGRVELLIATRQNVLHCYCVVAITIVVLLCKQRGFTQWGCSWSFLFLHYPVNQCNFVNCMSLMHPDETSSFLFVCVWSLSNTIKVNKENALFFWRNSFITKSE